MEQKKLSRPNKFGELFLFQISYVLPVIFINEGWKGVNLG